jgi:hypothetical protein
MKMVIYAQLNEENICVGISHLSGEVPEYNYTNEESFNPVTGETTTEQIFISRMIPIPVYTENYLGLRYAEDGSWEQPT